MFAKRAKTAFVGLNSADKKIQAGRRTGNLIFIEVKGYMAKHSGDRSDGS